MRLGAWTPGPNVWVDSLALDALLDSGPHHRYSTGQLYDNIRTRDPSGNRNELFVQNRAYSGTGHGWTGAQIMFWNCDSNFICDAPNAAMNWAVGVIGDVSAAITSEPGGIIESRGAYVYPRSLYYSQLRDRLGPNCGRHVIIPEQKPGNIWSLLQTWNGNGLLSNRVITWRDESSATISLNSPVSIGGVVRDLSLLDASPTAYQWSKDSGPGTITFGDTSKLETTASFSSSGTYTLRLKVTSFNSTTVSPATATLTMVV